MKVHQVPTAVVPRRSPMGRLPQGIIGTIVLGIVWMFFLLTLRFYIQKLPKQCFHCRVPGGFSRGPRGGGGATGSLRFRVRAKLL